MLRRRRRYMRGALAQVVAGWPRFMYKPGTPPPTHTTMPTLRHPNLKRLLAAIFLAMTALPTRAEIVAIAFGDDQRFSHRFEVAPGKFAEACGPLLREAAVQWRFSASRPLDFNIHYHEGKAVTYPVKRAASAGASGTLRVAVDKPYCWMWKNTTTQPASVTVELTR